MIVSILGCGWYGKALAASLVADGVVVKGSSTSAEKLGALAETGIIPYVVNFNAESEELQPGFFECDVLVISIPPKTRQGEGNIYLLKIEKIITEIRKFGIKKVIYISSTGVYGETNRHLDEDDLPEPDSESGKVLLDAETLFRRSADFKTAIIRFAGLVGKERYPGRFFAGKTDIPNGQAPVNLIRLDDCIGITKAVIEKDEFQITLNAVCPHHPPKSKFYESAAAQGGFTAPKFIDELNSWKIINSSYVSSLLDYEFSVMNWDIAEF